MSVKQFFKSNSFKCIAALLCVLLASGIILTIAYGFLEVTAGEKLQRAVKKIYAGEEVSVYGKDDVLITADATDPQGLISEAVTCGNAEINEAYKVTYTENGSEVINYLVSSKGSGGWSGGTVTCWVAVIAENNGVKGIKSVSVADWGNQTLSSEINGSELLENIAGKYEDGIYYAPKDNPDFIVSGATMSSTAICNAVNGAITFVKTKIFKENLTDKFAGFEYLEYIDTANPSTAYSVENGVVTYDIVTKPNGKANAFTLKIKVGAGGVISEYTVVNYGSTDGKLDKEQYNALVKTDYTGKDAAYFKSVIGENGDVSGNDSYEANGIQSGATRSNFLCLYAGLFATANYQKCTGGNAR